MNKNCKNIVLIILMIFAFHCNSTNLLSNDSIKNLFKAGKIVALKDGVALYRLNGLKTGGMYGYCLYDENYKPKVTYETKSFDIQSGEIFTKIVNNKCYTIVAPDFDYALPFRGGWGAVCKDGKWSFVDSRGNLMCDYVIDAAYPFEDGKAKILYNGTYYEIDTHGNGLPVEISMSDSRVKGFSLKSKTINQLVEEGQYEKAIEFGKNLITEILYSNDGLPELSFNENLSLVRANFAIMEAQNSLMASLLNHPELYEYYRSIKIDRNISYESTYPVLNYYNSKSCFEEIKKLYFNDESVNDIIDNINDLNYKEAIIKFEKWVENLGINISEFPELLLVYYYLSELSCDFETSNKLIIALSEANEKGYFNSISVQKKAALFSIIKKYRSAEKLYHNIIKKAIKEEDVVTQVIGYFNLGLVYDDAKDYEKSRSLYKNALDAINNISGVDELKLEIYIALIENLAKNNLIQSENYINDYVNAEIAFNEYLFKTQDMMYANKHWGNALVRIQKYTKYLSELKNYEYLQSAFKLLVFSQNIVGDVQAGFSAEVYKTNDVVINRLYEEYYREKKSYRGIDLYDLENKNQIDRVSIEVLYEKEKEIKGMILESGVNILPNYDKIFAKLTNQEVVINVVEYLDSIGLRNYGAFIMRGNYKEIVFVELSKDTQFDVSEFWPIILNEGIINKSDKCYIYAGKLANKGIEYEKTCKNGGIACFEYELHRVSALSHLNEIKQADMQENKTIALFGGLDYGGELVAMNRSAIDDGFLLYSQYEIEKIAEIMKNRMNVSMFSEDKGTVLEFMNYHTCSPLIIHFATHGYQKIRNIESNFLYLDRFNYYRQNKDIENQEWLMNNTGLYLSANEKDSTNILYSNDVARCDLQNTQLVVLSACNTIYGSSSDSQAEDIGLTTAFSISKVGNIITSIRDVDDERTSEFMVKYYENLNETGDMFGSFKETVKEMYNRYPNNKEYWSSFVFVENY